MTDRSPSSPDNPSRSMSASREPLALTLNPKLDAALQSGWEAWHLAAREAGTQRVATWLAGRLRNPALKAELAETIASMLADEIEERVLGLAEVAEIAEGHDDLLADTLWEGVLAAGYEAGDADLLFEAVTHLAAIAEDHDEFMTAAEYHLEFLNWRRQAGNESDPDSVATAFDEVIRLAELDGDARAAALFRFRQASFVRLADRDEEQAAIGDWERDPTPYQSWA